MSTLQELLERKAALDKQIEDTRRTARADAIAEVRALMSQHGLTAADISSRVARPTGGKGGKVAVKFREPDTGNAWTGRGLQPKWLKTALAAGKKLEDFAVSAQG